MFNAEELNLLYSLGRTLGENRESKPENGCHHRDTETQRTRCVSVVTPIFRAYGCFKPVTDLFLQSIEPDFERRILGQNDVFPVAEDVEVNSVPHTVSSQAESDRWNHHAGDAPG